MVTLWLTVADGDGVAMPVELADPLYDFTPDEETEVEKVTETVEDMEIELDPD